MWRAMERHTTHPGTPLFVRPVYGDGTWVPELVDYGVFIERRLWWEQFEKWAIYVAPPIGDRCSEIGVMRRIVA